MPFFDHDGLHLHYSERGDSDGAPLVMIHGLLWSSRMLRRLAGHLPGHRVLLIDLRGHGASSRPTEAARYSWDLLASDVVALLDHLEIERAVIGGLSLGANVSLATANNFPDRVAAMVVEMPVLDRAEVFGHRVFGALAGTLDLVAPVLSPVSHLVARLAVPASIPELASLRDVLSLEPHSAVALLHGLLADQLFLEDLDAAKLTMPALVIAHRGDPLHVLADAEDLVAMLPRAQLDVRHSIADYRLRPHLLAGLIERFVADLPADA